MILQTRGFRKNLLYHFKINRAKSDVKFLFTYCSCGLRKMEEIWKKHSAKTRSEWKSDRKARCWRYKKTIVFIVKKAEESVNHFDFCDIFQWPTMKTIFSCDAFWDMHTHTSLVERAEYRFRMGGNKSRYTVGEQRENAKFNR